MNDFKAFDPLEAKQALNSEVAIHAVKREIKNILNSYVGWFDPFCELIQNSLDALEERIREGDENYLPEIWIKINLKDNFLIVTDNGIGLDENKFKHFLAPNFSFKNDTKITRGHKGVGATYLAYGFNYIQISTKSSDFFTIGKMLNGRKWLDETSSAGNPLIKFDDNSNDANFVNIDRGVSVCLKFDSSTYPSKLNYIGVSTAEIWYKILSIKTGLGAFKSNNKIKVNLEVIESENKITNFSSTGVEYYWPHKIAKKIASYSVIKKREEELFKSRGSSFKLPSTLTNLDLFFDFFSSEQLQDLLKPDNEEILLFKKYNPSLYFGYAFSAKFWNSFNDDLKIRSNVKILQGGVQIVADNMPQGELISIPLQRGTNRSNQIHIVISFENCSADLGRKGFKKEIVDFAKEIARKLVDIPLQKIRYTLKPITGVAPDLKRQKQVMEWKENMKKYEAENPLILLNENFFQPTRKISITSNPSKEQDVIALFNQLIAGGVIRGVKIMATDGWFTYDGLYRVEFEPPDENHIFDQATNPLGVSKDTFKEHEGFISEPKILEYKYSLDGLIEDLENESKNSNDIGLVVVWETGEDYKNNYLISSLLDENNLSQRLYHGVTHIMTNLTTQQREMDLIVLKELIEYLNDPIKCQNNQKLKYEDY